MMIVIFLWIAATCTAIVAAGEPWAYPIIFASILLAGAAIDVTNWCSLERRKVK